MSGRVAWLPLVVLGACGSDSREATPPKVVKAELSERAARVSQLLDEDKLTAARTLLDSYLEQDPADAGMHAQESRYWLQWSDLVTYFGSETKTAEILKALSTAAELDEEMKPALTDRHFRLVHKSLKRTLDEGGPLVLAELEWLDVATLSGATRTRWEKANLSALRSTYTSPWDYPWVTGVWGDLDSNHFDAATMKSWAPSYEALVASAIRSGWYVSALRLAVFVEYLRTYPSVTEEGKTGAALIALDAALDDLAKRPELTSRAVASFLSCLATGPRIAVVSKLSKSKDPRYQSVLARLAESAVRHLPDAKAANGLAWYLAVWEATHIDAAVILAKAATAAAPTDGNYWNTLGAALYQKGEYAAAVEALDKSIDMTPGLRDASREDRRWMATRTNAYDFCFLALAYARLGDREKAERWLRDAEAVAKRFNEAQLTEVLGWARELVGRK